MSYSFELEGGVDDEYLFEISFNADPFVPERTNCPVELSHPAEGGEVYDLKVTFIDEQDKGGVFGRTNRHEVPEYLWSALGFARTRLEKLCEEHAQEEAERAASDEGERKFDALHDEGGL